MKNFKEHPITTIIGILFVTTGLVLLFFRLLVETKVPVMYWEIIVSTTLGLLLIISEDSVKDVIKTFLTFGINKLFGKAQ